MIFLTPLTSADSTIPISRDAHVSGFPSRCNDVRANSVIACRSVEEDVFCETIYDGERLSIIDSGEGSYSEDIERRMHCG